MPIYEYRCGKCGEFEIMQRITENPLTRCPTCHSRVTKLISHTSFQLKGTGWYATDYAHKGNGKKLATETKPETKSDSTAEKSSPSDPKAAKTSGASAAA